MPPCVAGGRRRDIGGGRGGRCSPFYPRRRLAATDDDTHATVGAGLPRALGVVGRRLGSLFVAGDVRVTIANWRGVRQVSRGVTILRTLEQTSARCWLLLTFLPGLCAGIIRRMITIQRDASFGRCTALNSVGGVIPALSPREHPGGV